MYRTINNIGTDTDLYKKHMLSKLYQSVHVYWKIWKIGHKSGEYASASRKYRGIKDICTVLDIIDVQLKNPIQLRNYFMTQ